MGPTCRALKLPDSILMAFEALRKDKVLVEKLGPQAVDYFTYCTKDLIAYIKLLTPYDISQYMLERL